MGLARVGAEEWRMPVDPYLPLCTGKGLNRRPGTLSLTEGRTSLWYLGRCPVPGTLSFLLVGLRSVREHLATTAVWASLMFSRGHCIHVCWVTGSGGHHSRTVACSLPWQPGWLPLLWNLVLWEEAFTSHPSSLVLKDLCLKYMVSRQILPSGS